MEPSPPDPKSVVTVEQTPQITTNFRAAKPLLDRKRPFTAFRTGDGFWAKVPQQDPPMRRIPLNEVHTNSFLQRSNSSRSWIVECPQRSKLGRSDGNEEDCLRSAASACANQSFSVAADGFVMPSPKVSVCSERSASALGSPLCCVLDDEFDESLLKEIDEICEQRSVEKSSLVNKSDVLDWVDVPIESAEKDEVSKLDDVCGLAPQSYLDYWKSLNEKQREAACSNVSTPLMIMAGPGSGKTSTMVGRVLMLLKEDFHPSNILAMTFTAAAASEMRDRIAAVVGKAVAKELAISTFHSFSLQLCRSHAEKLGRTSEFVIYGHGQQRRAIIEAFRLSQNEEKDVSAMESIKDRSKKWEKFVTKAKASGRTPEELREKGDEMGATILANYENILKSCNALDYHDFIICSVKLLTNFQEVYKECQETWKAIVVDEFQDTSSMQYTLLRLLASHNCLTVIGDDDQSIFSFNGADICGFESFRRDFQKHKEVRLTMNYRSTRCIVEAASALIRHNSTRCRLKDVTTFNSAGHKITLMECRNDESQCAFVVDKIVELTSGISGTKASFSDIAILYRKQVTGKAFQSSFRERKLPFNVHGVAFYRKKVIKAIMAVLRTTLPHCPDIAFRQSFKALLICDKDEKKKVIDHIEKISMARNSSFKSVAEDIFHAKISGTFKRSQILQGRKVLSSLSMLSQLVRREKSITTVISSTANMIPQTYLLEKRAVVDLDNGKYLNEEHDLRSVLRYLLDDVSDFLSTHFSNPATGKDILSEENGCLDILLAFLDYISSRETENFRTRKGENDNSITLTTIHQSKGLEWDTVFIVKVNESEIPLLHEINGVAKGGANVEEERRLLYVAMTRARKKLYILHVIMDSNWQLLQPSRFLKEIPGHLIEGKAEEDIHLLNSSKEASGAAPDESRCEPAVMAVNACSPSRSCQVLCDDSKEFSEECFNNCFLKTFNIEDRSSVSHMFHRWAKKPVFQNPKRLLDKVGFVIEERLRNKTTKNKDLLRMVRARLADNDAFQYAQEVLRWEQIPSDIRAHLTREKQEHFQKQKIESAMTSSSATPKQISYLQMLGCTVVPTSRLHASKLIEQYKSL